MRKSALLGVLLLAAGFSAQAAEPPVDLESLLKHRIVGDELPLAEVQRYVENRVPKLGSFETAEAWQAEADRLRQAVLDRAVYRGAAAGWRDIPLRVEWLDTIAGGPGYRIKKLRYEALPGLWVPALLYEPEQLSGKVPAILNVNGHTGLGKQYPPKQIRCINQAKRGMLALNIEWVGMGQLQGDGFVHTRMNQLDLCGTSGLAPFYLNMKRGLDVLLSLENADPERVAMTGLSGGGWQTIVLSSLDARIKLTNPVAGYSSFLTRTRHYKDLGDSEQTPCDLATVADYAHLTAMMAPRATLLTYNAKDECCFESGYALQPLLDAAQPVFRLFGKPDALRSHVNDNPGTHNYEVDNRQAFYRMLGDFFYPGSSDFDAKEIPSDSEVKPAEELRIDLPADNQSFNTLALALSRELPRQAELPANATDAGTWQTARLAQLRDIVRAKDYQVAASEAGRETSGTVTAVFWRLMMDSDWTVPVVEFSGEQADKIAILVADGGRESLTAEVPRRLAAGYRVLAVDPFYFGESKIRQSDWLFALLVGAVGERPLGLQASQLAAVARWAASRYEGLPITLAAVGPRTSTAALVAASLEAKTIAAVELQQALGSLKEVIEKNWVVNQAPELFCFGLLEVSDLKQLVALTAPRPVKFVEPSERVKRELAGIGDWYRTLGSQHDPLAP